MKTWLLIFTHHYQLSVIVDIGDFRGTLKDGPQTKVFDALEWDRRHAWRGEAWRRPIFYAQNAVLTIKQLYGILISLAFMIIKIAVGFPTPLHIEIQPVKTFAKPHFSESALICPISASGVFYTWCDTCSLYLTD